MWRKFASTRPFQPSRKHISFSFCFLYSPEGPNTIWLPISFKIHDSLTNQKMNRNISISWHSISARTFHWLHKYVLFRLMSESTLLQKANRDIARRVQTLSSQFLAIPKSREIYTPGLRAVLSLPSQRHKIRIFRRASRFVCFIVSVVNQWLNL